MSKAASPSLVEASSREAERLESWKEIAAYLKKDVRTIQRWEKREGFPVYRHQHDKLSTVYAYKPEIDAWWGSRGAQAEARLGATVPAGWALYRSRWLVAAGVAVLLGALWLVREWRASSARATTQPVVEQLAVVEGPPGRVSPDGRWLVYREPTSWNLMLRDLGSGEETRLAAAYARGPLTWSRDSRQVAFSSNSLVEPRLAQLEVVERNGTNRRVVWEGIEEELVEPQDWSADGEQLLCRARLADGRYEIVTISLQDKQRKRILLAGNSLNSVQFSPDGHFISYSSARNNRQNIYLTVNEANATEIALTHEPTWDSTPLWSADGRLVTFLRQRDASASLRAIEIDAKSGQSLNEHFLMTPPGSRNTPFSLSRDGDIFLTRRSRPAQIHLLDVEAGSGKPKGHSHPSFEDFTAEPLWAAHKAVVYYRKLLPDGRQALAIRNMVAGSEQSVYVPRNYTLNFFTVRPHGQGFTFFGIGPEHGSGFYDFDPATQAIRLLHAVSETPVGPMTWSPDGTKLLFATGRAEGGRFSVRVLHVASGKEQTIAQSTSRPFPKWSPDGKQIAYTDKNCLQLIASRGGAARSVTCAPPAMRPRFAFSEMGSLAWAKDGSKLSWTVHNEREQRIEMWIVDVASGKYFVWAGEANYGYWPGESTWSHDGTRIAFRMNYKPTYEVWRLRNILPAAKSAD